MNISAFQTCNYGILAPGFFNPLPGQGFCRRCPAGPFLLHNLNSFALIHVIYVYAGKMTSPLAQFADANVFDHIAKCHSCEQGKYATFTGLKKGQKRRRLGDDNGWVRVRDPSSGRDYYWNQGCVHSEVVYV